MDGQMMTEVLRIGREKLSDKGTTSAAKRVDPLRRQTGLPREAIIAKLEETFANLYGAVPGHITDDEYAEAEALVESKFATDAWLRRVP
jgi:lipoate-protein ligase A